MANWKSGKKIEIEEGDILDPLYSHDHLRLEGRSTRLHQRPQFFVNNDDGHGPKPPFHL